MTPVGTARRSIAVIAPNWLGDAVMMSPLLSLLRSGLPGGWTLDLVVREAWAPLFAGDPRLDRLVTVARPGRRSGIAGILKLSSELRRLRPHAVLVVPPSLAAGLAAFLASIPVRVGFRTDGRGLFLSRGIDFPGKGTGHYADQILMLGCVLLEDLGSLAGRATASPDGRLLPALTGLSAADVPAGPPVWVVAPGTTYGPAKAWPPEKVAGFIDRSVADHGVRIILLGDGSAGEFAAEVRSRSSCAWSGSPGPEPGVTDLLGRTSLAEAAALLMASAGFVGNDSGLMHLAAALGVPTVGVFGSSDPGWTAPRGPRAASVSAAGFACSPCFRATCNQDRFCLDAVPVLEVLDRLLSLQIAAPGQGEDRR